MIKIDLEKASSWKLLGMLTSAIATGCILCVIAVGRPKDSSYCWFAVGVSSGLLGFQTVQFIRYRRQEDRVEQQRQLREQQRQEIANQLSVCAKCVYYHGKNEGGNWLICAIHPHGQEDCPDFALEPQFPDNYSQ